MTGATGTDGAGHGLAVVRAARGSVPAQQAAWVAEAPVQRQASATVSGGWEADPDHDPRVMEAIRRGASTDALNRIRHFVATERNAAQAQVVRQAGVMWETRTGTLVDGTGGQVAPFQQSVVHREWEQFPDHQPSAAQPQAAPQGQPSIWADTHGG